MSTLSSLEGSVVQSFCKVEDYWQLQFDADRLTLINPVWVVPPVGGTADDLVGLRLESVTQLPDEVVLRFEKAAVIGVDLRDEAFTGPEALVWQKHSGKTVVWR